MASGYIYDGQVSFLTGVNAALAPSLIAEGFAARAINCQFRGGQPGNRMGISTVSIVAETSDVGAAFATGQFQGCSPIAYTYKGNSWLFACVSGRLYRLTPRLNDWYLQDFTPTGDPGNDPDVEICYFAQAEDILVIQDGQSPAYLVKGNNSYRADLSKQQVPIGTIMAYGFGRLWVAYGNKYVAGDLLGVSTDSVITFSDTRYLNENGNFSLPAKFGNVVGMSFVDQQDTATGQGPLLVFGQNGVESVNVSLPREQWLNTQIQVETLTNIGARGARSIVNVNGDCFFRSGDGIRSYRQARAEQNVLAQVPISTRVRPWVDAEYPEQLKFGSSIVFNNRFLTTCGPSKAGPFITHEGLLSLDFDPISSDITSVQTAPAWDGFWTTPKPVAQLCTGVFNGRPRAFAFTSDVTFASNGIATVNNGLSEFHESQRFDELSAPISSTLETRAFTCSPSIPSAPLTEKRIEWAEVFEVDRFGATFISLDFRQNGSTKWVNIPISKTSETTPTSPTISGTTITDSPPLYSVENRTYSPDESTGIDSRLNRRFFNAQFRIKWTGSLKIEKIRIAAQIIDDSQRAGL